MVLIGFLQAQNCSGYTAAWRHPSAMQDFLTPAHYQRIARTLEDAKFQLAFFDDRLAMPDKLGADHRAAVQHGTVGAQCYTSEAGELMNCEVYGPFSVPRTKGHLDRSRLGELWKEAEGQWEGLSCAIGIYL